jgi:nitroreductase
VDFAGFYIAVLLSYIMQNSETEHKRNSTHKINSLFVNRWSPRSMTGEDIDDEDLMSLFEAARWAPSSYNNQPWRFIYAKRNTENWNKLFDLLYEGNKVWAKNAAALVVVISRKNFEYNEKPSITHQFDAGAAWENLALEASDRGIATHGMQGFDYQRARTDLEIPESYDVMAMIAIGKRGPKENLPSKLQELEFPNDRKPLREIVMEGYFRGTA